MDSSELECPICHCIFNEVIEVSCCQVCFCKECIFKWLKSHDKCPQCRKSISKNECKPNVPFQRMVNRIPAECPNRSHGCTDTVSRGNLKDHREKCMYETVVCTYSNECGKFLRKELNKHLQDCKFRIIKCTLCNDCFQISEEKKHLEQYCMENTIRCTLGCEVLVKRKDLGIHKIDCPEVIIGCKYSEEGCNKKMKRKDLADHIKSRIATHLELVNQSKNIQSKKMEKVIQLMEKKMEMMEKRMIDLEKELKHYKNKKKHHSHNNSDTSNSGRNNNINVVKQNDTSA